MKRVTTGFLMTMLCAGLTLAQTETKAAGTKQPAASTNAAAEELKKIEADWIDAVKTKNADKLGDILADEWAEVRWDGKSSNKSQALADLKAPGNSLDSFVMGPMKVRFFGTVAIVTGSDTEKSTDEGKDSSGKYVWTDVFLKQNGQWKAVASQSSKVPK